MALIQINKSDINKEFWVNYLADNGEVLSTSETLHSKQSAWKNIFAHARIFPLTTSSSFYVDDCTGNKIVLWHGFKNSDGTFGKEKTPF